MTTNFDDKDFLFSLLNICYGDYEIFKKIAIEMEYSEDKVAEIITDYLEETEQYTLLLDPHESSLDIINILNDHILQTARNQIEELTGKDIINDYSGSIYYFANYIDCPLCCDNNDKEKIKKLIKKIKLEDRTKEINKILEDLD